MAYRPGTCCPLRVSRLLALGALLAVVAGSGGCVAAPASVNVSREAGLGSAVRLEVTERVMEPQMHYEQRLTVTDRATLDRLASALDADLPLGPLVDCLAMYRLRFVLPTGDERVFDYYCESGASFLTGAQSFWRGQQVTPPPEFDAIIGDLLRAMTDPSADGASPGDLSGAA